MVVTDQQAHGCARVMVTRLMLPAIVLGASMLLAAPASEWEPVEHTAECRDLAGSALPQGQTLVIWHRAGDAAGRDRADLQRLFSGRYRLEWRDVSQRNNALAARAAGVTGVPTIDAWHQSEASYVRFQGYKSAGNFLQRLEAAGFVTGSGDKIQNSGSTAAPENRPAPSPAIPRRQTQELPLTRGGDLAVLAGRVDRLEQRVSGFEAAQTELRAFCQRAVQDWNAAAGEWQTTIAAVDQSVGSLQTSQSELIERLDVYGGQIASLGGSLADHDERMIGFEERLRGDPGGSESGFEGHDHAAFADGENKELSGRQTPGVLGWLGFTAIQLATIAGITFATGGTGVLAWWAGNSIKRRLIAFVARRAAARVAKRWRGRPEVRSQDDEHFPRIHRPAQGDGVSMEPERNPPHGPGEYRRTATGWIRNRDGGDVPDRFEDIAPPPSDGQTEH